MHLPRLLEHATLLPDFNVALKQKLCQSPAEAICRPAGLSLLIQAVSNSAVVDLSPFQTLDEDQLLQILSAMCVPITSLNLSGIPAVTSRTLSALPKLTPSLKYLYVLGIPTLANRDVETTAVALRLHNIYHSGLLMAPFVPLIDNHGHGQLWRRQDALEQHYTEYKRVELEENLHGLPLVQMVFMNATEAGYETDLHMPRDRYNLPAQPCVLPLLHATASITQLFNGLRQFFHFIDHNYPYHKPRSSGSLPSTLSKCIATFQPGFVKSHATWQVRAIPPQLQIVGKVWQHGRHGPPFPPRALKVGEWTLVVLKENLGLEGMRTRMKYCFVTATAQE